MSDNKKITPFDDPNHNIQIIYVGATYQVARKQRHDIKISRIFVPDVNLSFPQPGDGGYKNRHLLPVADKPCRGDRQMVFFFASEPSNLAVLGG